MGQSTIKNSRRIFTTAGGDPTLPDRVTYLENNEYKILYFQTISAATGTITKPTNSTILLDQFYEGGDAVVETLVNGQPSGQSPLTAGGAVVSVSSFDTSGNFTLSGTPSSFDVALVYILKIKAEDYQNLTIANIMAMEDLNPVTQTITNGDTTHAPSSDAVYDALALKANLTDSRFKTNEQLMLSYLGSTTTDDNFDVMAVTTSANMASNRLYFPPPIIIREAKTITGATWFQDIQGSYTSSDYNGIGLYSYSGGTLTLVASTTNDGNIWKATGSMPSSKAFSTPYNASAGIYYLGLLWCSSATVTAPALGTRVNLRAGVTSFDFPNSGKLSSFVNSLTALPTPTQAMSGTSASNTTTFWAGIY